MEFPCIYANLYMMYGGGSLKGYLSLNLEPNQLQFFSINLELHQ